MIDINSNTTPSILIIDDLFGRVDGNGRNEERERLCGNFFLRDLTGDTAAKSSTLKVKQPAANAIFCRGQQPVRARFGDTVENDLAGTVKFVRRYWLDLKPAEIPCSMVLLDLCFYTGQVTRESESQKGKGMAEGRTGENHPSGYFGLSLLETLLNTFPDLPVVILSSKPRAEVSREFSGLGALGFLERDSKESPKLLQDYIQRHGLIPDAGGEIIGSSRPLLKTLRAARRASLTGKNLLIRGERGVGKELIARYLHRQNPAVKEGPLVAIDSGTLSPELYASALFGHRKGSFTGAVEHRRGAIEEAEGGDIFLDEIGNMPITVQTGLLRVLENRKVIPLGGSPIDARTVDVRFISATNADIDAVTTTGTFREDLYDRLREGGTIFLPPLRERKEDIPLLVEKFVRRAEGAREDTMPRTIEPSALEALMAYDWPGNVRELQNCIFNAVTSFPDVEHLVTGHLNLPTHGKRFIQPGTAQAGIGELLHGKPSFTARLRALDDLALEPIPPAELVGALDRLSDTCGKTFAGLLRSALLTTRKTTVAHPEGEVLIHPAMKLLTGNQELRASQAADIIKRIIRTYPGIRDLLNEDPLLREAYEKAVRLRPLGPQKSNSGV
jgi:DNA-binding NtrC family response regulator